MEIRPGKAYGFLRFLVFVSPDLWAKEKRIKENIVEEKEKHQVECHDHQEAPSVDEDKCQDQEDGIRVKWI